MPKLSIMFGDPKSFWVRIANRNRGPISADEVANLPDFRLESLVCPGEQDPRERRNWLQARLFPSLKKAIERQNPA